MKATDACRDAAVQDDSVVAEILHFPPSQVHVTVRVRLVQGKTRRVLATQANRVEILAVGLEEPSTRRRLARRRTTLRSAAAGDLALRLQDIRARHLHHIVARAGADAFHL
eukprot:scaffold1140_cov251-Pinguiococcus_pyrenoidosus.AAC.8